MTIGSLCLTEILKSWKSCSSKRLASQTALSTSASGVALPYFCSRRGSSEPAFTPMRMRDAGGLRRLRDLADLVVELADVARVHAHRGAAGVDRGEDVVRLEVDVGDDRDLALLRDDRAAPRRRPGCGTATRTMSHPDAVSSAICCRVALMFVVGVVVIDCTLTWASPPTSTLPTLIWRDLRRGARTSGTLGIPRFTAGTVPVYAGPGGAHPTDLPIGERPARIRRSRRPPSRARRSTSPSPVVRGARRHVGGLAPARCRRYARVVAIDGVPMHVQTRASNSGSPPRRPGSAAAGRCAPGGRVQRRVGPSK